MLCVLITFRRANKYGNRRHPTGNVLIETPVAYILKTEQHIPFISHDKTTIILFHFTLRVNAIPQKLYNILVLGLYQISSPFMEFNLGNSKCVGQLLHSDYTFADNSLRWQNTLLTRLMCVCWCEYLIYLLVFQIDCDWDWRN